MSAWIAAHYPWLKALHLIAAIAWMAGMLYLPRLYVYHAAAKPGSELSETLKTMERRLLRAIVNPAMGATFALGGVLLWNQDWSAKWLWAKLVLVVALSALHGLFARWRKDFAADRNTRPARFYRIANRSEHRRNPLDAAGEIGDEDRARRFRRAPTQPSRPASLSRVRAIALDIQTRAADSRGNRDPQTP
jgi:putative membrane protein